MSDICVSVVVPMYNVEKYIAECVESIIHQTYSNLDIILVNDGSEDGTLDICKGYAEKDSRISLIDKPNSGITSCRVAGLEAARGDYIYFSDSDDVLEAEIIEKLLSACIENNAQVAACGFRKFGAVQLEYKVKSEKNVIEKDRFVQDVILPAVSALSDDRTEIYSFYWNHLYRADCLTTECFISDRLCTREDTYTNLMLLDRIDRIAVVPEILYRYRISNSSVTVAFRRGRFERDLYYIDFVKGYLKSRNISCDDRVQSLQSFAALGNIDNFCKSGKLKICIDGLRRMHKAETLDTALKNDINNGMSASSKITAMLYLKKMHLVLYFFRRLVFKMKGIS